MQARDRYARAAQQLVSDHMARHGDPRKRLLGVPLIMVASGCVFLSVFNGVRVLMASGVGGVLRFGQASLAHTLICSDFVTCWPSWHAHAASAEWLTSQGDKSRT